MAPSMGPFLVATLALLVVPGPSVVFVVTRAVAHGRAAGLVSVVGLEAGLLVHVVAAALGVGALVASSGPTLAVLRVAGVAYLVVLGLRHVVAAPSASSAPGDPHPSRSRWVLARDAFAVDLLNPQTVVFFLAFLPQFVDVHGGTRSGQLVVLGACVVLLAFACDGAYVLVSTALARRSRGARAGWDSSVSRRAAGVTSAMYVSLAVWATVS